MHCVNRSHPDYKSLLKQTELHPDILELQIGKWMDANGNNRFPTLKEIEMIPLGKVMYNANPIKALGLKYNANQAGFMPYNVDLAQLQRDAAKINLTVHKARTGQWFLKDSRGRFVNPQKFYQLKSESSKLPEKELTEKLLAWARKHGIEVKAMNALIDKAQSEAPFEGAVAVANLLNKIIEINPNEEKIDTLAEEVAHFATLILAKDASVKKAMEKITETDIYKEVKEVYAEVYTEEDEFKKEAVDKLLAQSIVKEFEETSENKGILPYLKATWNKFKRWLNSFKKSSAADEIKKDLYPLAQSILQNEFLGKINPEDIVGKGVFEQRSALLYPEEAQEEIITKIDDSVEKAKAKFAVETANKLNDRLDYLRRIASKKSKLKSIANLQESIDNVQEEIGRQEFTAAIMSIMSLAQQELEQAKELLDIHKKNKTTDGNDIDRVNRFVEMYEFIFKDLAKQMELMEFSKEDRKEINSVKKKLFKQIGKLNTKVAALEEVHSTDVLTRGNTAADGGKIDPTFNEEEAFKYTKEDASRWRVEVGNYKLSNSPILRSIHKLLYDVAKRVKRFATEKGNLLLQAQVLMEKSGVRVEDLIEKDSNKNYTQFLIREEDWAGYYEARAKMKEELAKHLGFEIFRDIDYKTLSKEQQKIYKDTFKNFNKAYTTAIYDQEGNFVARKPKAKNKRFIELMKNPHVKRYYDLLINTKEEALAKLPIQYRTEFAIYMLPGIRQQLLEKITDTNQSFFTNLKEMARESFFVDEDDVEFGEVSALNNRMVPIYFTTRFEKPGNVSRDLTRSFTMFAEMAENFKESAAIAGDMSVLQSRLGKREYQKNKKTIRGTETNDFKILETLAAAKIYGIQRKDYSWTIPDTWLTRKLRLKDKQLSFTKLSSKLARFISTNNLALNPFTSTAGYLKGSIDKRIEATIGLYTTLESDNWSRTEYAKNILHVISEIPRKKQTNKMHLLLQRNNVVALDQMLRNTNKNKLLGEVTSRDLLFINYRTADYAIKGRVALSIYDNIRLYNGNFLTKERFIQAKEEEGLEYGARSQGITKGIGAGKDKRAIDEEWKSLKEKSLYNAYEVVEGQLVVKEEFKDYVTDAVENAAVGKVEHVAHMVDGTLSDTDKGALARGIIGDFVLMHRGWFVNMIDTRFNRKKVNFITGEEEIGYYNASWQFIKDDLINNKNFTPWAIYGAYKGIADPAVKRGVKKTFLDLLYLQIVATLAGITNVLADDDEDDNLLLQYTAYQLNRVLLEQAAGQPLLNPSEILQIMDEPVVGVRTIKDIVDITESWNLTPYESGMYKGHSHMYKWWMRKIPAFKNIYESQFPDMKNNFLKNQVISSWTYDLLKEKKEDEWSWSDRMKTLFGDSDINPANEREAVQYIESYEEDM